MSPTASPSDLFMDAFGMGIGSPEIHCSCGRRHCAPDSEFIDSAEQARMEAAAKVSENVILHRATDSVYAKEIGGITSVVDCPCNWLARLEALLWRERERVLAYYRKRRDADAASAAALDASLTACSSGNGRDRLP